MPEQATHTFAKREHIVSRKLVERLFGGGGSRSLAAFPLRLVYLPVERAAGDVPAQVLISVPKRHFKHAVKRNRVKRKVREAYRMNKPLLAGVLGAMPQTMVAMAFVWQAGRLYDSADVDACVKSLLVRLAERLEHRRGAYCHPRNEE